MPVSVTLPVLVSVKFWVGPATTPRVVAAKVCAVGSSVALITAATPVPLSDTGEPATATLAVIGSVAGTEPAAVGLKTTVMVQVVPAAKVAPQVPPNRV